METSQNLGDALPRALPPGTQLMEFEVREVLGAGGFGVVYRAFDQTTQREVAIKEYMPASLVDRDDTAQVALRSEFDRTAFADGLKNFILEARILTRFDHPSLLKVHRFWEANGTAYMAMNLVQGQTLKEVRRRAKVPPSEGEIIALALALLGAIDVLHNEGVFHRDIAPDNIIIERDGRPVLLDFGAARQIVSDRTQALDVIVKPAYAPIEQYSNSSRVTQGPWTDIYALGATLYFLLHGHPPTPATSRILAEPAPLDRASLPAYGERFLQAVEWMMAPRPSDRPQNAAEAREALLGRSSRGAHPFQPVELDFQIPRAAPAGSNIERTQALPPAAFEVPSDYEITGARAPLDLTPFPTLTPPAASSQPTAPSAASVPLAVPGARPEAGPSGMLSRAGRLLRSLWPAKGKPRPSADRDASQGQGSPLLFGLTAPRTAVAGSEFSVSFAAYIEAARAEAARMSLALVGDSAAQLLDVEPSRGSIWQPGTPFVVHLSGRSFRIEQPEQAFEWSGTKNVLGFAVQLLPESRVSAVLTATVRVHGIVIATLPFQIGVAGAAALEPAAENFAQRVRPAPCSAFASYASKDIAEVSGRLSSLTRHAPGLKIFQDCLDLRPGESYKSQLQAEIAVRDVFWLFWSRRAAASPWVRWELDTAIARKSIDTIIPMPLEDPTLAPPPVELEHEHFRDRFMMAGQALLRIQEQASKP